MARYKTVCGKEFDADEDCFMHGLLLAKNSNGTDIDENTLHKECRKCEKRYMVGKQFYNSKTGGTTAGVMMFCPLGNIEVDYQAYCKQPSKLTCLDEPYRDLKQTFVIELTFMFEDAVSILYYKRTGIGFAPLDNLKDIVEEIYSDLEEYDDVKYLAVYAHDYGYAEKIEVENERALWNALIGARIVDYQSEWKDSAGR